jgi:hypothetical protein
MRAGLLIVGPYLQRPGSHSEAQPSQGTAPIAQEDWIMNAADNVSSGGRWLLHEATISSLLAMCLCGPAMAQCQPENIPVIIQRATAEMQSDWTAFPGFAFVERDEETSKHGTTITTHRVFMIEGTDYYMPIAVNDQPYTAEQLAQEHQKLLQEIDRRRHETAKERQHRSERYWKERNQTGILLEQYTKAFDFRLVGEELVNGHLACVLDAVQKPDYRPPNREAKILTGMQGRMWIDSHDFHWVKAQADVLKPVSILGIAVRVLPGTHMELQMAPVSPNLWLVSRFTVKVKASVLWMSADQGSVTNWSEYRPAAPALAQELASPTGALLPPRPDCNLATSISVCARLFSWRPL